MAHVDEAAAGFPDDGEGFDQKVVEGRSLSNLFLELDGLGGEVDVGQPAYARLESLTAATMGSMPLISRWVLVPKIFARMVSTIMNWSRYGGIRSIYFTLLEMTDAGMRV